jgi:hypothetical protein
MLENVLGFWKLEDVWDKEGFLLWIFGLGRGFWVVNDEN